jgi:hypothetical protein
MNISKLKYTNKETAISDLITKNVIDEEGNYQQGIHAVVEIGLIALEYGTYDEQGNVITEPIYADGYHYDVMSEQEIDFGNAKIEVNNPKHTFAGY